MSFDPSQAGVTGSTLDAPAVCATHLRRLSAALALALAVFALAGCGDTTSPFFGVAPTGCGANSTYDAFSGQCVCLANFEYCSADPSDSSCCAIGDAGGVDGDATGDTGTEPTTDTGDSTTCSGDALVGSCDGNTLTYCEEGATFTVDCAADGAACDFNAEIGLYDCVSAGTPVVDLSNGCAGLPPGGWCENERLARYCSLPTGAAEASLVEVACGAGEQCVESTRGASCQLAAGAECRPGQSECADANTARGCTDGQWETVPCDGACVETALGANCAPNTALSTYRGTLTYDMRWPNDSFTDWDLETQAMYANNVLMLSFSGDDVVDAAYVGATTDGEFELQVAPGGSLLALAAWVDAEDNMYVALLDPGLSAGEHDPGEVSDAPVIWAWRWSIDAFPSGSSLHVSETQGAGILRVYTVLLAAVASGADALDVASPPSVVAWMGNNVTWSCGACFADVPTDAVTGFDSQLWIGVGADAAYWSDPVTAHEAGHHIMFAHGEAGREGGTHTLGVPTHPGQAWSEGWATYFSSALRQSPVYYDKQGGGFFWLDLSSRAYASGAAWQRPDARNGLFQLMDENEVSAQLWRLDGGDGDGLGAAMRALASPRMTTAPFLRGYTQRTWDPQPGESPIPYESTRVSAPFLADFFDAMLCDGLASRAQIDAVTEPSTRFPYPSNAPLCP